ncbi:flagellar export protein FliJ [bacterium]|nr:flagellar export protein FliJ [bacterium]MCP5463106.1 flagellar export protein FliJ [bacterium]
MFKKFSFKLQNVLNLKTMLEEKAEKAFSTAIIEFERERSLLTEMEKKVREKQVELKALATKPFSSAHALQFEQFIEKLDREIIKQIKKIEHAEKNVEIKRLHLLEATKDKKIIEKLCEKEFEKYSKEINLLERNVLNDIAVTRYYRNTMK